MKKTLYHAFSDRSLREQECLVHEVVDDLITQLRIFATGEREANMVVWVSLYLLLEANC